MRFGAPVIGRSKDFLIFFPRIYSPGSQVPRWGGTRHQNPEGTNLSRFSVVMCRSKPVTTHVLMFKRSHQRLRSPIVRFFALRQMGGERKNFFQEFRLLLRSVLFAAFLIKKRVTIHMDCKDLFKMWSWCDNMSSYDDGMIIKGHRKVYLQNIDGIWLAEYQKTWIWSSVF